MSYILNIDTSSEIATISIANSEKTLAYAQNTSQKDHASFTHTAIAAMLKQADLNFNGLNAISVCGGPGSYTGIRIGMAAAKGLCYALNIPLIITSSLEIMALSAIMQFPGDNKTLYCPMIDARRMEVFTAVYDRYLTPILQPSALILQNDSFKDLLVNYDIIFTGGGSKKLLFDESKKAKMETVGINPEALRILGFSSYNRSDFADPAFSEPFYLKNFAAG